ncbi:hypothetical protein TNCV_1141711 [Trichonephila clavipes]|nr:hypothetical protein TNCV_1141711 [Trichonephila clavipes]
MRSQNADQEPFNRPRYMWRCAILHQTMSLSAFRRRNSVQTLLWVTRLQHLDALEPIGKHVKYRAQSLRTVEFGISNTRAMPLAVSVCPAVTVWCTSMTTSSETVGRPGEVCYRCSLYLRISALNHAELAEYLGRVVVDDCGDTHARLPQRSSHFGNRV